MRSARVGKLPVDRADADAGHGGDVAHWYVDTGGDEGRGWPAASRVASLRRASDRFPPVPASLIRSHCRSPIGHLSHLLVKRNTVPYGRVADTVPFVGF